MNGFNLTTIIFIIIIKTFNKLILFSYKWQTLDNVEDLDYEKSRMVTEYDMYKGFIVFDRDNKVFIGESKKKSKIEKRMQLLKEHYQLELIDKA